MGALVCARLINKVSLSQTHNLPTNQPLNLTCHALGQRHLQVHVRQHAPCRTPHPTCRKQRCEMALLQPLCSFRTLQYPPDRLELRLCLQSQRPLYAALLASTIFKPVLRRDDLHTCTCPDDSPPSLCQDAILLAHHGRRLAQCTMEGNKVYLLQELRYDPSVDKACHSHHQLEGPRLDHCADLRAPPGDRQAHG